jgi:hypothetical protein
MVLCCCIFTRYNAHKQHCSVKVATGNGIPGWLACTVDDVIDIIVIVFCY